MARFVNPYPDVVPVEAVSTIDVPYRGALDNTIPPIDNFQPEQVFTQRPMDLQNVQMTSPEPNFGAGQPQSVVSGLFSPELSNLQASLYQQNQNQAMRDRFTQFAQLSPLQQASVGFQQAGYQLGQGVGGALGGVDPQLKMIALTQQIAQGTDLSNPQSLYQAAQKFAQIGNLPLAKQYADQAKVLQESLAKTGKEAAETTKITQETTSKTQTVKALMDKFQLSSTDANAIASNPDLLKSYLTPKTAQGFKLLETGKYTPESIALWADNKGELEPIDKQTKTTSDFLSKAVELGFGAKAKYGDYTTEQVGKINKELFDDQIKLATAKATNIRVGVDVKGEEAFAKGLGELDAKAVAAARDKRDASLAALNSLKQLNALNQNDLISGSFATGRVGATNLLASLGLASGKDVDKLASSENYQKVAGDVILSTLGGRLGAGFSNEDRKFIQSLVPQLENSSLARRQLIEFMTKKNQDIVDETTKLENYARENKSLKGFIPTIPIVNLPSAGEKPLSQMSTQELQDLRSKLMKR